jgi:hypothetical protein
MGGWVQLGSKTDDDWPFVAKEFETRYRGYRMRDDKPDYPRKMVGLATSQNGAMGMQYNAGTVLIGDEQKAIEVIKGGSTNTALSFTRAELPKLENKEN